MACIGFVFSGQGAQHSGMGKNLSSPAASSVFRSFERIMPGLTELCFSGSDEDLRITRNTQPALYAVEMACAAKLAEEGIKADYAAGFSLGELSALAYAGVFSPEEGFRAVLKRAELMQEAAEAHKSAMTAVLKLSDEKAEEIASRFRNIYPVNYNCPGQVVCAGLEDEIALFEAEVKKEGGRAMRVAVSGGFHSPFMREAAEGFREYLDSIDISRPSIPVYSDKLGALYGDEIRDTLSEQIASPVRWTAIIRDMISRGVDEFIELGPGSTLSSLIRRIDPSVKAWSMEA